MKTKTRIVAKVVRVPNRDSWMVQWQFSENGPIFTKDNHGTGYSEELATQIARFCEEHPDVVERQTP